MKIGVIQLTSILDYKENIKKIRGFLKEASDLKLEAVFLPECFYSMSNGMTPTPYLIEEDNEHFFNIKKLATDFSMNILAGSAATKLEDDTIVNRVYNFTHNGENLGHYDKMNLFSCNIVKDGVLKKVDEGIIYSKGTKQNLVEVDGIKIGIGVCVDVRYSEFALKYKMAGAQILTFSSAFTVPTGKAHWHTLLRARAIENQCFVIAPAQWGQHNDKTSTYGHSLIIDPWGDILKDAGDGEKLIWADLDLSRIKSCEDSVIMTRSIS